ncbi:MFS transporter [Amycolatopsis acidiphila]|uniref:MFS transporter n=1 Tax=Amycolatopsis acidiphila TaxID=715473 RepID=A0A558AJF7_9PSEU|nr:MFS transporter [Amycolatopsis acidiphila]TVT24341.1 MFS transporter [Amycolatopsis acidiphila]UIJ62523.1 MFS transporter [Amycolatopsis acidiphila]GHG85192.1 MFS transporter [Amycolatopsis acidiphila]
MQEEQLVRGPRVGTAGTGRRSRVRWIVIGLAALGTTIAYVDRGNLSVAMPFMQHDLHLDPAMKGIVLSSFFWTYAIAQLPSGWLIDRLGARIMYAAAAAWWGVFTGAVSLARGLGSILGLRLLLGIGEAPIMPSNTKVVSEWFPRHERAFASSIFNSGTEAGSALSLPICTLLIGLLGWRWSFAATGVLGLLWAVGWATFYRKPRQHRRASPEEVAYIEDGNALADESEHAKERALRWRDLLRYRSAWGLVLGYICRATVVYFFVTWFPSYLADARGMKLLEVGLFGVIPGLTSIAMGWSGGWLSDRLLRRGTRLAMARKIPLVVGMLGGSLIALAAVVPSAGLAVALLAISYGFLGFAGGSVWALPADIAPSARNVGALASLQNFGSQIGGILSPIVVGALVGASGGYVLPLLVIGGVTVVGAAIYGLMIKVEPLPTPN